jgi:lipopolysaccharide transport system ATP-binding protein
MSDIAIRVDNLSKLYKIGALRSKHDTLRDRINDVLFNPLKKLAKVAKAQRNPITRSTPSSPDDHIWALKDVSFEVKRGEVIGIIGRNGAGKTTLLKILSRITEPTEGRVEIRGRVGSLLEVGTGFHPELTGRENIYLNGAILGMKKNEIERKFDEIVAFAEIEKFLDTPVKRYSSGMYVRLAFAVAAHLDPEILLVDEVLAVGDAAFQKKCLGKMGDVAKEGRTVLFVSHDMGAINSLTGACIYLRDGQVSAYGRTLQVVEQYLAITLEQRQNLENNLDFYRRDRFTESPVRFTRIWVNEPSNEIPVIEMGSSFSVFIEMEASKEIRGANLAMTLRNIQGHRPAVFFSLDQDFWLYLDPGKHTVNLQVDDFPLAPGQYFAMVGVNQSTQTVAYDSIIDFPLFQVVNNAQVVHWLDRPWGCVHWAKTRWLLLE